MLQDEIDINMPEPISEGKKFLHRGINLFLGPSTEEPMITRRLSRLPAWIPKAPDTAPMEADPFQLRASADRNSEQLDNSLLVRNKCLFLVTRYRKFLRAPIYYMIRKSPISLPHPHFACILVTQ
jgi:hypothetical protein